MGLLTEIAASTAPASQSEAHVNKRQMVITEGAKLFDEQYSQYEGLGNLLEADDEKSQYEAGLTLLMVERTRTFIENMSNHYGESTVTSSLGALPRRVLDVVRKAA